MLNPEIRAAAREFLAADLANSLDARMAAAAKLADGMDLDVLQQAMFIETLTAITSPVRVLLFVLVPPERRADIPGMLDKAAVLIEQVDRFRG